MVNFDQVGLQNKIFVKLATTTTTNDGCQMMSKIHLNLKTRFPKYCKDSVLNQNLVRISWFFQGPKHSNNSESCGFVCLFV